MKNIANCDKKLGIHHHLVGLVLMTIIPVLFFASGLVAYLAHQRSQALEYNLLGTTRALNAVLDEQIVSVVSSLKILSVVEDFRPDSIQYLHKRLRRFVNHQEGWAYISFVDTQGVQIFNTSEAYGSRKLQRLKNDRYFQEMLKKGKTVISGHRDDGVISVSVPVKKNGMIIYALVGALKLEAFSNLLNSQKLPRDWAVAIMDKEANILARSKNLEKSIGQKAATRISEKNLWKGPHLFNDTDEGAQFLGATVHSKITGWTLVLSVPNNDHLFSYWQNIAFIITGGAFLVGLSVLAALYIGKRIARPILALSQSAKALGQGKPLEEIKTSLQEVHDVDHALRLAAEKRGENEDKINSLYKKAQEAVGLRDTFLSVASHELKTPLTTLKLQFQMLDRLVGKKELVSKAELEKPFARVQNQLKRLMLLIDDLLDVSRISAGKIEYHPETFDLVSFTHDVVMQFEGESTKAGSPISITGDSQLTGKWDRHRLEQVLVNLITNAIKYGNARPITISLKQKEDVAEMEITDRGLGIAEENMNKIFERYERVGEDRSISGLGLGLWIVQRILDGFGASISVTSKLGEGSCFKLRLPLNMEETQKLIKYNLTDLQSKASSLN